MLKVIKGGTVVTSSEIYQADVLTEDEKIVQIAKDIDTIDMDVIDARGAYLFPGGIDPHTHFNMPFDGITTIDDFESGTISAAFGATTTVIDCAIQQKGVSLKDTIATWHKKAEGNALIDYSFHVAITDPNEKTLGEIKDVVETEGISSFKLCLAYKGSMMVGDDTLFKVMLKAKEVPALVSVHCENGDVIDFLQQYALRHDNKAPKWHAYSRPNILEGEATHRAITLSILASSPVYIVPVTAKEALEEIMRSQGHDQVVFAETCPQYLLLDQSLHEKPNFEGAKYIMSPPLRSKEDRNALWTALKKGYINTIGSGHCAFCMQSQKELGKGDFSKIPNGGPGVEDRFGLIYSHGVEERRITLNRFVSIISTNSAKIFGLFPKKGTISVGSDADIVVWDPTEAHTISKDNTHSRADYNMYEGFVVQGRPTHVISRGHILIEGGKVKDVPEKGKFIKRAKFGMYL